MVTLIHGDNIEASRQELNRVISDKQGKEIRYLNGKNIGTSELTQALESSSLFGGDTMIVIDGLISGFGKKTKAAEEYYQIIARASVAGSTIVLWENKEISKTTMGKLGKFFTERVFKLPVLIFTFLDNFRPKNTKYLIDTYEKLVANQAPELVWAMLVRRIRQLIMLADGESPEGLQSWQVARLTTQSKYFSMEQLLALYKRLIDTELSIKSGTSAFDAGRHLELLIIDI